MTEQTLRERLDRAADDRHVPPTTDVADLVVRARAARDRRRRTTLAAVALTAVAVVGTSLGVRAAQPGDRAPAPAPPATDGSTSPEPVRPLTERQVARRCHPQLAKYDTNPMYSGIADVPARGLRLLHPDRRYEVGDVVALTEPSGMTNPALCLVPEAGAAREGVPFSTFTARPGDHDLVLQRCGENLTYPELAGVDLREGAVVAEHAVGEVIAAVIALGPTTYTCWLSPVTWDAGIDEVAQVADGYQVLAGYATTGASNKSIVGGAASWYIVAGRMPARAATVEWLVQGGGTWRVPVDADGYYARVIRDPGPGGLLPTRWRVLDADGKVLREQRDWQ